jgi:hypothetical protein
MRLWCLQFIRVFFVYCVTKLKEDTTERDDGEDSRRGSIYSSKSGGQDGTTGGELEEEDVDDNNDGGDLAHLTTKYGKIRDELSVMSTSVASPPTTNISVVLEDVDRGGESTSRPGSASRPDSRRSGEVVTGFAVSGSSGGVVGAGTTGGDVGGAGDGVGGVGAVLGVVAASASLLTQQLLNLNLAEDNVDRTRALSTASTTLSVGSGGGRSRAPSVNEVYSTVGFTVPTIIGGVGGGSISDSLFYAAGMTPPTSTVRTIRKPIPTSSISLSRSSISTEPVVGEWILLTRQFWFGLLEAYACSFNVVDVGVISSLLTLLCKPPTV